MYDIINGIFKLNYSRQPWSRVPSQDSLAYDECFVNKKYLLITDVLMSRILYLEYYSEYYTYAQNIQNNFTLLP